MSKLSYFLMTFSYMSMENETEVKITYPHKMIHVNK